MRHVVVYASLFFNKATAAWARPVKSQEAGASKSAWFSHVETALVKCLFGSGAAGYHPRIDI